MTEQEFLNQFSKKVRDYRGSTKQTQEQAAKSFDVPVQTLRNWEYKLYAPTAYNYIKVVQAMENKNKLSLQ